MISCIEKLNNLFILITYAIHDLVVLFTRSNRIEVHT